jgi:hypothetical protein
MDITEAYERTLAFTDPCGVYIRREIKNIEYAVSNGKFYYSHNTEQPNIPYLKELIKRHGYRVFICKTNGYPLWFIYWGNEIAPKFNCDPFIPAELIV